MDFYVLNYVFGAFPTPKRWGEINEQKYAWVKEYLLFVLLSSNGATQCLFFVWVCRYINRHHIEL